MIISVGLRNPGDAYRNTPHNVGAHVLLLLASQRGCDSWRMNSMINAEEVRCDGVRFILPCTYMNHSGQVIAKLRRQMEDGDFFYNSVILVHDDIDVALGRAVISTQKGSGGHNGVRSVMKAIDSKHIIRIRIGVAPVDQNGVIRKPERDTVSRYLLSPMSKEQQNCISSVASTVNDMIVMIANEGVTKAQNTYNT